MKVLVIDRDRDACDQIGAVFEAAGSEVVFEPIKNKAVDLIKQQPFDVIIVDPAPQNEIRAFIMAIRRMTNSFPPVIVASHSIGRDAAIAAGANNFLDKPFGNDELLEKARCAERITQVSAQMADESEDFPSKDGIIAKSAFNQLFITCLDRADRHGERSYMIFVAVDNYDELVADVGAEEALKVANNLRKTISRTRRTSDIAGHIKVAEFSILLLRPTREDEPLLAANRFAETLRENIDLLMTPVAKPVIKVWVLSIPSGEIAIEHVVKS